MAFTSPLCSDDHSADLDHTISLRESCEDDKANTFVITHHSREMLLRSIGQNIAVPTLTRLTQPSQRIGTSFKTDDPVKVGFMCRAKGEIVQRKHSWWI